MAFHHQLLACSHICLVSALVMPKGKQFDVVEKAKVLAWHGEGVSTKEIAARLGRHIRSIQVIIKANRDLPPTATPPPPKRRSGRPRITTAVQDERLRRHVLAFPFHTAKELKRMVEGWSHVSVRRIQAICQKRLGLPSRCAAKKPLLTDRMVKKRLAFCRKHRHWTEEDWENVMFSDESKFDLYNPRAQKCRRPSASNRYKQRYVVTSVKHSPSVMIWGCFSGKAGRASIHFLPAKTTMNSDAYINVLREKLFPWMASHRITRFLQDGAPCHTSKKSMAVLKEKEKEFTVMDWPGNSPDLNPIENLWSIMKRRLKKDHTITSLKMLQETIKNMWISEVPTTLCKKLARSMPQRIRQCIENDGQMTKY